MSNSQEEIALSILAREKMLTDNCLSHSQPVTGRKMVYGMLHPVDKGGAKQLAERLP